jgi:hypothetical protein
LYIKEYGFVVTGQDPPFMGMKDHPLLKKRRGK